MSIKIQENISLSKYTSFKIGGFARYFCAAENIAEIKEALEFAGKNKLKIFVLGGGSNLLISDKGFDGLVIRIMNNELRIMNNELRIMNNEIFAGSGLSLAKLVSESVKANLTGLEWAAGIPGTVGGAICNNTGAYGECMGDIVKEVEVIEIAKLGNKQYNCWLHSSDRTVEPIAQKGSTGLKPQWSQRIRKLNNKQCEFFYRDSIFKKEKKHIIISAVLKLEKGNEKESREKISEYLKSRAEKQPLEYPSAGSVFRNPVLDDDHLKKLIKENPELENISKNNTIPAGWFVEELGLKGKKIGGAMVSKKHGNFIVNTNSAKAEDVAILISLIKQKVRDKFGIQLREEIEYAGF